MRIAIVMCFAVAEVCLAGGGLSCGDPVTRIDDAFWSPRLKLWRTVTANYVLDRFGHIQPPYAAGELIICGAGVSRGYVKLPDCTPVAEPTLGDPICDILGQARPIGGSALGSAQSRITPPFSSAGSIACWQTTMLSAAILFIASSITLSSAT